MSDTIKNANSVSSFALVIGLTIAATLLAGIGAIIYRKKYHLNFKFFVAKFKNNNNNKINNNNNKTNNNDNKNNNVHNKNSNGNSKNNNKNNKINYVNNKNSNGNSKNNNKNNKINHVHNKNGDNNGNGKKNKNNKKKNDNDSTSSTSKGHRSKTAKNNNNVLPNNNLFLTKNGVLADNNNRNNNNNISLKPKPLNHQNLEKGKMKNVQKQQNQNHLHKLLRQQSIGNNNNNNNKSEMNEITKLPTAYAPNARGLYNDDKRSKSYPFETPSSSSLSYHPLSTSPTKKPLKSTQTKTSLSIKSSSTISSSNEANEVYYESSQNSSRTVILNLCDYYTNDNNTTNNNHVKSSYIDSYYQSSNYNENAEQEEGYHNYGNDTNNNYNNESDNKIKTDVNESHPVNIKPLFTKLKKKYSYDNYSISSLSSLEPLSPPPLSTPPPPPSPLNLQNNESSSTITSPKNFSISDSFKTLTSSSSLTSPSTPTSTIIRPRNFSISDSFKTLTSSSPPPPSNLNSWLTSSPNKNDNTKNDKILTLKQNADGSSASSVYSSDSGGTKNSYTNSDNSEDENSYENFIINQRKNATVITPPADSTTHQMNWRNFQIVTQNFDSQTPLVTPLMPRQAQLRPLQINSISNNNNNNDNNNNNNRDRNRSSGYIEYNESDVSNYSDEESIYYSRTDSISIDPHLYDKSNTNSIYYSNDEDNEDVKNIINTTVLIDNACEKISRLELIKETEYEEGRNYGHNEEAAVFDSHNHYNDSDIKILVEDKDFNEEESSIELLPKLPKIIVNKNLSINFERFSIFRNAPGCIDREGYYNSGRNLNGNNRVANIYLKPGSK